MVTLTPESMAQAVEKARYELLRSGAWSGLRESERFTRVETLISAFDAAGVTQQLAELSATAALAEDLAEQRARDDERLATERAERSAEVVRLTALISTLRSELAEEIIERAGATSRARSAEARVAAAREALSEDNSVADLLARDRRAPLSRVPRPAEVS